MKTWLALLTAAVPLLACGTPQDPPEPRLVRAPLVATPVRPNDALIDLQSWQLDSIRAREAWSLTTGSSSVMVAVIDSGRRDHPELNGKWSGGYDFWGGSADPTDPGTYHHGVHVAGIIAAQANNQVGIAGVCWGCSLMPIRAASVLGYPGDPGMKDRFAVLARAIRYAAGLTVEDGAGHTVRAPRRADVINISLGNYHQTCVPAVQAAVNDAVAAGTVVVAAASNRVQGDGDASNYFWPTCQNVIVVTAIDHDGRAEPYATAGNGITVGAPGGAAVNGLEGYGELSGCVDPNEARGNGRQGVLSSWMTGEGAACYRFWAGTSMATPLVAGAVALVRSINPLLTPAQIQQLVQRTAQPVACTGCGAGRLDAYAAVAAAPFNATMGCDQTDGRGGFRCETQVLGGAAPITARWRGATGGAGSVTTGASSAQGVCRFGQTARVGVTLTDGIGRTLDRVVALPCDRPERPRVERTALRAPTDLTL